MKIAGWILPSIGSVLFLTLLGFNLAQGDKLLNDADTAWHIRAGDSILRTGTVPETDIFSYTMQGKPWIAHEWLSEVIFSLIHRASGTTGIVIFSALLISATFTALFRLLLRNGVSMLPAVLLTVLAAATSANHWWARPHLFSIPLTLLWVSLLDSYQSTRRTAYLYVLPAVMVFWVNLHGGYFTGLLLLGIFAIAEGMTLAVGERGNGGFPPARGLAALSLAAAGCVLAALVNPFGYRILVLPFLFLKDTYLVNHIGEWTSPSFHGVSGFEIYLLLILAVLALSPRKLQWTEIGLLLFAVHMSLFAVRFHGIFAVIVTPFVGRHLQSLLGEFRDGEKYTSGFRRFIRGFLDLSGRVERMSASMRVPGLAILAAAVLLALIPFGNLKGGGGLLRFGFDPEMYPVAALDFVRDNHLTGHVYNKYYFGGYLIYRFFPDPDDRVFVDGRAVDLYGDDFFKDVFEVVDHPLPGWKGILDRYDVQWVIHSPDSALSAVLLESRDWALVYADRVALIFARRNGVNQPVIDRYPDVTPLPRKSASGD
jgi:hypothetical protein